MIIHERHVTHIPPHVHHHSTTFEHDTANHHCRQRPQKLFLCIIIAELSSSAHHSTTGTILPLYVSPNPPISMCTCNLKSFALCESLRLPYPFRSSRPPSTGVRVMLVICARGRRMRLVGRLHLEERTR